MSLDYTRRESQAWVKLSRTGYYNVKSGEYQRASKGSSAPADTYEASRRKREARHQELQASLTQPTLPSHTTHQFLTGEEAFDTSVFLTHATPARPEEGAKEVVAVPTKQFQQEEADTHDAEVLKQYARAVEERIASL